jgi:two-component system NtrC family sensor kinase
VDINQVVTDTLAIVDHHLRINNVEMNTHLKPELASVIGNAQQLQQVFLNIALNAQKAMPQGGKLIVETRQIDGKGEHKVEVIFADTDGGIPAEELEKIFDPIPPTAAGGQETSLDLSVSQDIIKRHGGEIRVKSEESVPNSLCRCRPLPALPQRTRQTLASIRPKGVRATVAQVLPYPS